MARVGCVRAATLVCALALMMLRSAETSAQTVPPGAEFRVNTYTADDQQSPSAAALESGGFVVVWASFDQGATLDYDVYAQRYDATGAPAGGELRVNSTTDDDQESPRVVGMADGGFLVVWQSRAATGYDVFVRRFDANGAAVGAEVRANTHTADDQQHPAIARGNDDTFVVVWQSFDQVGSFDFDIYGRRLTSTGQVNGTEFLVNSTTSDDQTAPAIVGSATGGYLVAWQSLDADIDTGFDIYTRLLNASAVPPGPDRRLNATIADDQEKPAVSAATDGSYVVAWQSAEQDGSGAAVIARRVAANGTATGAEIVVNQTVQGDQSAPALAVKSASGFVVSWQSFGQDAALGYGVFAREFDAAGVAATNEFAVNTTVADDQQAPSVESGGDGGFVIAWQSFGQDAPVGDGVYARRYAGAATACGDVITDGSVNASDALGILKSAVGLLTCQLCVCDVNSAGGISATDALVTLNFAVGLPVSLTCPGC
jgi:hypothetical protein